MTSVKQMIDDMDFLRGLSPEERRAARERVGVSLREAAEAIGVSPMTIGHWERGGWPQKQAAVYGGMIRRWYSMELPEPAEPKAKIPKGFVPAGLSAERRKARARIAGLASAPTPDPQELGNARRDYKFATLEQVLREKVFTDPPLTIGQRLKLASIILGGLE